MERVPVGSSNIASIGYDANSETLEIEFLNGSIYEYYGVPAHTHQELMNAGSHGSYLSANIKNAYPYARTQ
ncbi:KTSC domain-containing protein [Pseudomonas sp. zfem001]|uniref:KTSC domain-containing protein n=1 Tax=Pseudomonas sp. zfem001 TaxID=3078196 RepID=UPI002928B3C0|nr:KTSC domain-containing protein [Pseudomonas sp. zfem001]MDU9406353.1 KTSC domain-containing protein [Pseudomonas sp. zfem001]